MKRGKTREAKVLAICLFLIISYAISSFNSLQITKDPELIDKGDFVENEPLNDMEKRGTRAPLGWMDEMRLTYSSGDSTGPDMAVWGNNVHVVWSDDRNGHYEIYYKRSVDNGLTWSSDIRLTSTSYDQCAPKITTHENNIHVVWFSMNSGKIYDCGSVYYVNSTNNGENWGMITEFDTYSHKGSPSEMLAFPDITVSGNNIYIVAYSDYWTGQIIFTHSTDNGNSWSDWVLVTDITFMYTKSSIETDGYLIHIVEWIDSGSGDSLKHYYSNDQGETWSDPWNPFVHVEGVDYALLSFATSMQGNNLRVGYSLWEVTNINIYTMYWKSGSWYGPSIVGEGIEYGEIFNQGYVDVYNNHIVWDKKDENNNCHLFSNMYGQLTDYPSNSSIPSIAISGNVVHVVWVDDRDGNKELYYSQRGLFPDLVITNSDIQFDPPTPVAEGIMVYINATVFSYSKSASNIEVKFYNGDPDTNDDLIPDPTAVEIGNDTIDINEDSSTLASIQWDPPTGGEYNIFVWADPNNNIQEYNDANNLANKTLVVISIYPSSPQSLNAFLNGNNIKLSWNASPDDDSGDDDVVGYTVYKSITGVNGNYEFTAWILANNSLIYNWIDFGAGDGDLNDYFYIVRANDTSNNEEQNTNKVGKVVNYLSEGWNLVSLPLIQANTSREYVLQTIEGNYTSVYGYHAGKSRPWLHWHRDKPNQFNDEIEVNHGEGYYMDMLNSDHLIVAGKVHENIQIQLKVGWNLVGYPSLTNRTVNDALYSISGMYDKVYFFNTTSGKDEVLESDDLMHPGSGYWIHCNTNCVWEVAL